MAYAARAVGAVGSAIEYELPIVDGVSAWLNDAQLQTLTERYPSVQKHLDATVHVAGNIEETFFPTLIGAADLHRGGVDGRGVTIAVLDTGLWKKTAVLDSALGTKRLLAQYDVLLERQQPNFYKDQKYDSDIDDGSGHGTHISAIAMSSDRTVAGRYQGSAPNALNGSGEAAYSVLQQGAGLVDAAAAAYSVANNCANIGLNIAAELANQTHYLGPVRHDSQGTPYLLGPKGERLDGSGYTWSRQAADNQGYTWSRASILQQGYTWSRNSVMQQGYVWSRGFAWSQNESGSVPYPRISSELRSPKTAGVTAINNWVSPE